MTNQSPYHRSRDKMRSQFTRNCTEQHSQKTSMGECVSRITTYVEAQSH